MAEISDIKDLGLKDSGSVDKVQKKNLIDSQESFDAVFKKLKENNATAIGDLQKKINDAQIKVKNSKDFPTSFKAEIGDQTKAAEFLKNYSEKLETYGKIIGDIDTASKGLYLADNANVFERAVNGLNAKGIREQTLKVVETNAVKIRDNLTDINKNKKTLESLISSLTVPNDPKKDVKSGEGDKKANPDEKIDDKKDIKTSEDKIENPVKQIQASELPNEMKADANKLKALGFDVKDGTLRGAKETSIPMSNNIDDLKKQMGAKEFIIYKGTVKQGDPKSGKDLVAAISATDLIVQGKNVVGMKLKDGTVAYLRIPPGMETYTIPLTSKDQKSGQAFLAKNKDKSVIKDALGLAKDDEVYLAALTNSVVVRVKKATVKSESPTNMTGTIGAGNGVTESGKESVQGGITGAKEAEKGVVINKKEASKPPVLAKQTNNKEASPAIKEVTLASLSINTKTMKPAEEVTLSSDAKYPLKAVLMDNGEIKVTGPEAQSTGKPNDERMRQREAILLLQRAIVKKLYNAESGSLPGGIIYKYDKTTHKGYMILNNKN